MGLEAFKTEGPRTRSKSSSNSTNSNQDVVHVLKGIDEQQLDIPNGVTTHTVIRRTMSVDPIKGVNSKVVVCTDCKSTSESYETKLKVDKLEHRDKDWYPEFMEQALSNSPGVDDPESYDEEIEQYYDKDHSEEYESSSGDDSTDDDDFNSGLSAFTS